MQKKLFFWLLTVLLLASCQDAELPDLPADEIIMKSAERMNAVSGFEFVIDRSGEPVYLDLEESIAFRRADGYYVAPDKSQATVRIITPGLVTDVGVISIGEVQWQTNLLTPDWQELPPNWGFNPAVLFDAEIGIQSILLSDLSDLVVEESEVLEDGPDGELYVISGRLAGERVYELSNGLIGPETMTIRIWIGPETFELYRVLITDPSQAGAEPTIWQVDFRQFDQTIEISPPPVTES